MELDLVVSVRHGKTLPLSCWEGVLALSDEDADGSGCGCDCDDGVAPEDEFGVVPAALEKKPRMFCCLLVEDPNCCFGAGRAGVRAVEADLPAMVTAHLDFSVAVSYLHAQRDVHLT
jgi:hypothetical protein